MTDQFTFLGDNKGKAAIAATTISLGVLLLLPASLGYGGTIIQEAFGQFNALPEEEAPDEAPEGSFDLPLLEDTTPPEEDTTPPEEDTTPPEDEGVIVEEETPTTPSTPAAPPTGTTDSIENPSTYMLADRNDEPVRGFIGSTLPTQGAIGGGGAITPAAAGDSGHIVTGRFRLFANDTLVRRFVAEMNIAAIDGSSFNNITITEGAPHRFEVTQANGSTGAQGASSNIVGSIYLNGGTTPVIDNVPMTLTIRGQSLAIQGIDIDEARIADTGQRDTVSAIDGQSIYGTIPRV
jgi:cytoskeletal protein RodZ